MLISDVNSAVIQLNQATSAASIGLHLDVLKFNLPKLHLSEGKCNLMTMYYLDIPIAKHGFACHLYILGIKQLYSEMFSESNGDRQDAPNIAIVVTDREGSLQSAIDESDVAKSKDIFMSVVGIGSQVGACFIILSLHICACFSMLSYYAW